MKGDICESVHELTTLENAQSLSTQNNASDLCDCTCAWLGQTDNLAKSNWHILAISLGHQSSKWLVSGFCVRTNGHTLSRYAQELEPSSKRNTNGTTFALAPDRDSMATVMTTT